MVRKRPDGASIAEQGTGAKLVAPSAERNKHVIAEVVKVHAPSSGAALELASGTGQHVVTLAAACPDLRWQPTEIDPERRGSIDQYAAESGLPNIRPALHLDATKTGWAADFPPQDFVILANLLHLISVREAQTLIDETAKVLAEDGVCIFYGPFKRKGALISESDQAFHLKLITQDPEIGYKDSADVIEWAKVTGLSHVASQDMPANNLAIVFRKQA